MDSDSPGCNVFVNMASLGWCCGLTRPKEASFYRRTVTVRVSRVSRVIWVSRVRVRASVRIVVRFSFSNSVGVGLLDVE